MLRLEFITHSESKGIFTIRLLPCVTMTLAHSLYTLSLNTLVYHTFRRAL